MKTPDDVKKGLECCFLECDDTSPVDHCRACPYKPNGLCFRSLLTDALAYIQQLEMREWDLFDLITSAWFGKRCYFQQDDGTVYSRASGEYMSFDQAIDEFAHDLTCDRECAQAGKDTNVPRWISVEDRLPENTDDVLIITPVEIGIGYYDIYHCCWYNYVNAEDERVTYWMPLPEPPKEG